MKGGVKRMNHTPTMTSMNSDTTLIKYRTQNYDLTLAANLAKYLRCYSPGNSYNLANATGVSVVSFYSEGKFMPGTSIRWEPNCSFNTNGRVYVGFTDNPEAASTIAALTGTAYVAAVQGLGNVRSFPVWQETDIPFPTKTRRKMFDINSTLDLASVDQYDRSVQTTMFVAIQGDNTTVGHFAYHDVVQVEGITNIVT